MPVNPEKTEFGELFVAFDVFYPKLTQPQKSLIQTGSHRRNHPHPSLSLPSRPSRLLHLLRPHPLAPHQQLHITI